ncbi:hypothetical protein [Chroococcus sp. FPU101]|uniref:hypothetical protein n=1 Tax=Chroococcus sp. FPU101 TaxID=1974212 RepID=UPI001A8FDCB1|nr:hypothetical protein [Chroococcus sp. FPU101]GFE72330.1 unknown protein [Chroococcus sp. FPU101]
MPIQEIKEQITQYLEQLPEQQLHQLADYAAQLVHEQQASSEKKRQLIHSLRGKYANSLSSSEAFAFNKQDEIDWEERTR